MTGGHERLNLDGELGPLWRAIAVFRLAALAYVVALVATMSSRYAHPIAAWGVAAAMGCWTGLTWWWFSHPERRRWPLLGADLLVTGGLELTTPWVVGRAALDAGAPTLAVVWLAGPVLTWAVAAGRRFGLLAALVLGAVEVTVRGVVVRGGLSQSAATGVMLMLLAAIAVGHAARLVAAAQQRFQRAVELEAATREREAATRERERLARGIHDSVLQVLALVQRRGSHLGGEAGELARLAGEQEAALRALISVGPGPAAPGSAAPGSAAPGSAAPGSAAPGSAAPGSAAPGPAVRGTPGSGSSGPGPSRGRTAGSELPAAERGGRGPAPDAGISSRTTVPMRPDLGRDLVPNRFSGADPGAGGGAVDLRSVLSSYVGTTVTVSAPADPVWLDGHTALEVGRAAGAALHNVSVHCGKSAHAWVLVEEESDAVTVTIRDEGPGFPEGRLAQAREQGRLGVAQSIRGRITDLGGTVLITSSPGEGTEVELRIPRT